MSTTEARKADARKIASLVQHEGWPVLQLHLEEQKAEGRDFILSLMSSKPESLTGRVALRHGMKVRAYTDLGEWIEGMILLSRKA